MVWKKYCLVWVLVLATWPALGSTSSAGKGFPAGEPDGLSPKVRLSSQVEPRPALRPALQIAAGLENSSLELLLEDVLERNPALAEGSARVSVAVERVAQARALPQPFVGVTTYVQNPETRTGPQRLAADVTQSIPWKGKRALEGKAAGFFATAAEWDLEAQRLALVTEVRRLVLDLHFVETSQEINREFKAHLVQHEEISRARYSTGVGPGQSVVKLQAEITRTDSDLLALELRQGEIRARINALRDRPPLKPIEIEPIYAREWPLPQIEELVELSMRVRPELSAAKARIAGAQSGIELAGKSFRPDFRVGLTYTVVDDREDTSGRVQPPEGNGEDVLGIQGGITVPLWRKQLDAGVREASHARLAAEEAKRGLESRIHASIVDLAVKVELRWRQLTLLESLLVVQAQESVESAQAGYITGALNAFDLLDAAHVLFEARTAVASARTDYLVGLADLEGAVGAPLSNLMEREIATP